MLRYLMGIAENVAKVGIVVAQSTLLNASFILNAIMYPSKPLTTYSLSIHLTTTLSIHAPMYLSLYMCDVHAHM